ncbi:O-antigen ligase family protein [Clostridium sp. MCC353]|uniref:O-antigen ligase family protein n=1 Tax=Clostridium sp. MCC353 TaxID=2592646 RepID=UPI001C02857A|nr:O-antigen ligase family protein [Clostridium sp. MCC353]
MMSNKKKTSNREFYEAKNRIMSAITGFFVLMVLAVLPLIVDDFYFNILETKYKFYWISMLIMFSLLLVTAGIFFLFDITDSEMENTKSYFRNLFSADWKRHFSLPDIAMIVFWLGAVITTLISDYKYESFWGNEGRYNGLFLITIYFAAYFCITRYLKFKDWYVEIFLFIGMLVCLFGITDYFKMDLLHFKVRLKIEQYEMFTSTLGNVNTYTAYVALVVGAAATLFATAKDIKRSIYYYICVVISFFAIITGQSDNAYLTLAALFGFLPLYLFGSRRGAKRYLALIATFFTTLQGVIWISRIFSGKVIGFGGLFYIIAKTDYLIYVVVFLWLLTAVVYFADKGTASNDKTPGWLKKAWVGLIIAVILCVSFVLYDCNFGGSPERYQAFDQYLRFDDTWGTNRGYIWRIASEMYNDFSWPKKLFGYGLDTFKIMTINNYYNEMIANYKELFDSVHNEYLQYLVTMGAVGLISYLALLLTTFGRVIKKCLNRPAVMAVLFSILCYCAQATVNINIPIAAPVMWTLIMAGNSACREQSTV